MLLSLGDYSHLDFMYGTFFRQLESRCQLIRATSIRQSLHILRDESISAVIVFEPQIMSTFRAEG